MPLITWYSRLSNMNAPGRATLLMQPASLEVDAPTRDLVVRQVIDNAKRNANLLARGGNSGKFAQLPAYKLCLKAGLILSNEYILQFGLRLKGFVIEVVQHLPDCLTTSCFVSGVHNGEDGVFVEFIQVVKLPVLHHHIARTFW